mmetsp:Transcript_118829/g.341149  ORF Transcript_118829/g.341149 Transcript_118829/m.341149 type:complete len:218 (-) Transcript_118829:54-707(-)
MLSFLGTGTGGAQAAVAPVAAEAVGAGAPQAAKGPVAVGGKAKKADTPIDELPLDNFPDHLKLYYTRQEVAKRIERRTFDELTEKKHVMLADVVGDFNDFVANTRENQETNMQQSIQTMREELIKKTIENTTRSAGNVGATQTCVKNMTAAKIYHIEMRLKHDPTLIDEADDIPPQVTRIVKQNLRKTFSKLLKAQYNISESVKRQTEYKIEVLNSM